MCERYICGMGFTSEEKPIRIIHDNVEDKDYYLFADLCKIMNEQHEEIIQLKFQLQNTCDQRDEFYRGARENVNRVGKLEKENEQLRKEIEAYPLNEEYAEQIIEDEPNFEDEFIKDTETGEQYNMYGACELLNKQEIQIELLNDELEQCKAVIDNRWSEYLKKKGVIDDD